MQRVKESHPATLLLAMAFVMSPFCDVAGAQEEQVSGHSTGDREPASVHTAVPQGEIAPPDVFAHVALVRGELELIRSEMGKPRNTSSEICVSNVAPREVFFQALTLFRKANAMCFELTRQQLPMPDVPEGEIRPADVWRVVKASLERIEHVKTKLSIPEASRKPTRDDTKTPTDVFRSIVEANRQLNLLLDHQSSPGEVFQQVTSAVGYASRLLARFPSATRIPSAPPFERGKRPADVFVRLLECYHRLQAITDQTGLAMLTYETDSAASQHVTPSDVYDLATLIVSELAYLHSRAADIEPPENAYYPGRKFPAHVWQRAGILERQLEQLQRLVKAHPNWLDAVHARSKGLISGDGRMDGDK